MDVLDQMASGYAPIASGMQPRFMTGFEGAPFVSSHPLAAMLAQPYLSRMMGNMGMVPMGVGHDQNIYDTMRHRQFASQQRQAMANMAFLEQENLMRSARGAFAVAGMPFGAEQRRAVRGLTDMAAQFGPAFVPMFGDQMDQMHGMRGSPMVMAQRMMNAGRYQIDPATGRMGIGADSMGQMAGNLYGDLYGSRRSIMEMSGLTAGQAGSLYEGLVQRGMVGMTPGSLQDRTRMALGGMSGTDLQQAASRQNVVIPAGGTGKLTADDLDKLTLDPGVADRLRSFDSEKIKKSIKSYAGAVSAVRDIFGDNGRPNAPMHQLIQGLEALTLGNMSQMDPDRASRMVRQTYNLARNTGVGIDQAMMIQQHAASKAAQLGLEPIFAMQATHGGLAFGGAYRGMGLASHTAWGAMGADQLQQADVNLRVGAASSNAANRLAVAMRLSQVHGGFQEGSEASNLVNAVRGGFSQFVGADGSVRQVGGLQQKDFFRMLTGARGANGQALGISENDVREMMGQRFDNREVIERNNIGQVIRNTQGSAQLTPFLANRLQETLTMRLTGQGMNRDAAMAATKQISQGAMSRIMGLSTEEFANEGTRNTRIGEILEEELAGTEAGATLSKMGPEARQAFLRQTASRFYGRANEAIRSSGFRGLGNLQNVHRLFDPRVLAQADLQQQTAAFDSRMQEALSPLGRGTPLQRAMEALQNARPGDNMMEVVGQALGGVRTDDISKRITAPMQELNTRMEAMKNLHKEIQKTPAGPARDEMLKRLGNMEKEARSQAAGIAKTAGDFGIFAGNVTARDTRQALDTSAALAGQISDVSSLRGGFGLDFDPGSAEADRAREEYGYDRKGTKAALPHEAAAVIMARREKNINEITEVQLGTAAAKIREQNPFMTVVESRDAARQGIINWRRRNITMIKDADLKAEMESGRLGSPEELRALVLARRQGTPLRADDDQVKAALTELRKVDPTATEADARDLADSRQRAKRWGIGAAEIDKIRAGAGRSMSEQEAVSVAVEARERSQFNVTDSEVAEEMKSNPAIKDKSEARTSIINKRNAQKSARFSRFWTSEDGARFRENVERQGENAQSMAEKLVSSPDVVRRFGTMAIDMHNKLSDIQQRRKVLAFKYTGGDMAKLMAGDFAISDPQEYAKLQDELRIMHGDEQGIFKRIHSTHGKTGRQFRDSNDEEAARILGISDEEAKRLMTTPESSLSPEDKKKKEDLRRRSAQVGVARNMTGDDETKLRAFSDRDGAIDRLAARHGVSKKELLDVVVRGQAGSVKLSMLSADEKGRRDTAVGGYDAAMKEKRAADSTTRSLERAVKTIDDQIAKGGPGVPALEERKRAAQTQLDEARARSDSASKKAAGFASGVDEDARRRGVTTEKYLAGQGFMTPSERDRVLAEAAKMGKGLDEIKEMATRLGVPPDELPNVLKNVVEPQLRMAEEHRKRSAEGGMTAVQDIAKAFGMGPVGADDPRAKELAGKFGTPEGKRWAQYMSWTAGQLGDAAKSLRGGGGANELASRWKAAMGQGKAEDREKALKQLQTDLLIDVNTSTGRAKWDKITESLDFQQRAGLLEDKDGKMTMDKIGKAYDKVRQSGDLRPPGQPGTAGAGGRQEIYGELRIRYDGQRGDINARTGGAVGNTAAP